jgi:UDP-N-acetylmuramoyl-tripeptide--D-alanyl-D-alanine ligase
MHQAANALAAAAAATALNVPIEVIASALSTAEVTSKWRMELKDINGLLIINDAYNANPESMLAALRTLALLSQERGGRSWAFLGTMHELGNLSESAHAEIATAAAALDIDHLVAIGNRQYQSAESIEMVSHYYAQQIDAYELFSHFEVGDVILVKASRAEHLEIIAAEIAKFWSAKTNDPEETP